MTSESPNYFLPEQLIEAATECEEDEDVEDHPLEDVDDHFAKWNLEGSEVGVDAEDVDQLEIGRDHARGKHAFKIIRIKSKNKHKNNTNWLILNF